MYQQISPPTAENGVSDAAAAARRYLEAGFAPIPIPARSKNPNRRDWQQEQWTLEDIPKHWTNGQNIGLLNGEPSGWLIDIDLDCELAVKLAGRFLHPTLTSGRESNPDSHWWYFCEGIETQNFYDLDGRKRLIELRSTGSQTVVAPSVHPSGDRYRWSGSGLKAIRVSKDELLHQARMLATAVLVGKHLPELRANSEDGGGRHDYALALAGYMQRNGITEAATLAILKAAWDKATSWPSETPRREAMRDLESIVTDTARNLRDEREVKGGRALGAMVHGMPKTIGKYWNWPRQDQEQREEEKQKATGSDKPAPPTHDELRDRFLADNPDLAYGIGSWQLYGSGIWSPVSEVEVKGQVSATLEDAKPEGIKPTLSAVNSVSALSQFKAFVRDDVWDADPDILVCANGVLYVPSGDLQPHAKEHYATSAVPYDYDPNARAEHWRFLLNSAAYEVQGFLQEFAGYALTTETDLETAVWLHGPPGSGKSTFLLGLETMLGARAGTLGLADIERTHFALSGIAGKTLLTAAEQPSAFLRSTHIINQLISGEKIRVEQKYRDGYDLIPRAKLAWAMNELPRIGDANSGIFRRVKVVTFPAIAPEDRLPELKSSIAEEGPGILNWALEGLKRLRERGHFEIPDTIQSATESFRESNDVVALFVEERCDADDPEASEKSSELYREYKFWCEENGHKPLSSTRIAEEWKRLGLEKYRSKGTVRYKGVRVRMPTE